MGLAKATMLSEIAIFLLTRFPSSSAIRGKYRPGVALGCVGFEDCGGAERQQVRRYGLRTLCSAVPR